MIKTGMGVDSFRPTHIKWLPRESIKHLTCLFDGWNRDAVLPWQLLCMLIHLLAKPSGGERPICLEPFVLRLFLRQWQGYGRTWSLRFHGHWDDVVARSSALRAGLLRSMLDEAAVSAGFIAVEAFLDLEKYYGTMN